MPAWEPNLETANHQLAKQKFLVKPFTLVYSSSASTGSFNDFTLVLILTASVGQTANPVNVSTGTVSPSGFIRFNNWK